MKKVYIAGPYSLGDVAANVRRAILVAQELRDLGYVPFVPHLTHFWLLVAPRPYEDWVRMDLEWLAVCDLLLRLPGASVGADREVTFARQHHIPVVQGMEEFRLWDEENRP